MRTILALCVIGSAALTNSVTAADVKSGLEVGDFPMAYYVTDITGPAAGSGKLCYRCRYGAQPVVNIFARKMNAEVIELVKQIDDVVGKNRDERMAAFVVMLTDEPDAAEEPLKKIATEKKIKHTPLTVFDNSVGPNSYKLSEDAAVTVVMWVDSEVRVNHALTLADLKSADVIKKVASDTSKILN